jgi:hypothetical protein
MTLSVEVVLRTRTNQTGGGPSRQEGSLRRPGRENGRRRILTGFSRSRFTLKSPRPIFLVFPE